MKTVLITGANRGLGLEFARQYAADGWQVHACCRRPEQAEALQTLAAKAPVTLHPLDLTNLASVDALAATLRGTPIDVLLNNAGLFGPRRSYGPGKAGQHFGEMDYEAWQQVLAVNTLAPFKMAEAFVENVAASQEKKIVTISSSMGSIAQTSGGYYSYRSSKAAVNMVMATLARDLASRGIIVALFCPGWAKTDMGGPDAPIDPTDSIAGMRRQIAHLTPPQSGRFTYYDGTPRPW